MSRAARISNLLAVVIPFVAFLAAIVLFWGNGVGAHDLVFFAVMYLLTGFGVTIGFHRLLTHRSFATSKPVEYLFADPGLDVGAGARDLVGLRPPQAPRARRRGGRSAQPARRWRHGPARASSTPTSGWLISEQGLARKRKYAADLMEDTGMRKHQPRLPVARRRRPRGCPRWPATSSPGGSPARSPACCGAASCASSSSTT